MTICYFGIYNPEFSRNKVYMTGLRKLGVNILECIDTSKGILKYWRLWKKHRIIHNDYDVMIVGYPGHIVVPLARIISRKPIILDALCSLYEGEVISRGKYRFNLFMKWWIVLIDWLAVKCADIILVETNTQKDFFIKRFSLDPNKVARVFTGADEEFFYPDISVQKRLRFTVVFRGKFLPEAGVKYIVKAAEILEKENVDVLIIGNGLLEEEIKTAIDEHHLKNIEWLPRYLNYDELRCQMISCHVSLGQFEDHLRLKRTIPHKAFESLAMGLPYITGRNEGVMELLKDGETCLTINPADPAGLAGKIIELKNNPELARKIGENGRKLFEDRLTAEKLAGEILGLMSEARPR